MARPPKADARSRRPAETGASIGSVVAPDRTDALYRQIHAAIVGHRLPPGTRLPEEQLADVFGVSRTLVRQALQRLAHQHLVVQEPNRGVRIAEPTIDEVRHLYEVRRLIECALLTKAAARLGRTRLAALRRLVVREARANAAGDSQASMQLAGEFHLELASSLANPVLSDFLRELIARGNVAIAVYEQPGRATCRCDDHGRILACLANNDVGGARDAMSRHLQDIESSLTIRRGRHQPADLALLFNDMHCEEREAS